MAKHKTASIAKCNFVFQREFYDVANIGSGRVGVELDRSLGKNNDLRAKSKLFER